MSWVRNRRPTFLNAVIHKLGVHIAHTSPCTEMSEQDSKKQAMSHVATAKAHQLSAKKRKTKLVVVTYSDTDPTLSSNNGRNPVLSTYVRTSKTWNTKRLCLTGREDESESD